MGYLGKGGERCSRQWVREEVWGQQGKRNGGKGDREPDSRRERRDVIRGDEGHKMMRWEEVRR